jgi:hypothetical protein
MITKYSTYFQPDHWIVPSMAASTLYCITDSFVKYVGKNIAILLLTKYLFMREDKIVSLQNLGIICKNRVRNIQEYRLPNQAL